MRPCDAGQRLSPAHPSRPGAGLRRLRVPQRSAPRDAQGTCVRARFSRAPAEAGGDFRCAGAGAVRPALGISQGRRALLCRLSRRRRGAGASSGYGGPGNARARRHRGDGAGFGV